MVVFMNADLDPITCSSCPIRVYSTSKLHDLFKELFIQDTIWLVAKMILYWKRDNRVDTDHNMIGSINHLIDVRSNGSAII